MQLSSSTLYYAPIYNNGNALGFFQTADTKNALTREALNKLLAGKKIDKIDIVEDKDCGVNIGITAIASTSLYFISLAFIAIALSYTDPVTQSTPLCNWTDTLTLNNTALVEFNIHNPCYIMNMWPPNTPDVNGTAYNYMPAHKIRDLAIGITFASITLMMLAPCAGIGIKYWNISKSPDNFNEKLDLVQKSLSYVADLTAEVPDKDIKLIFPYLSKKELPLLNFLHLKKAKKHFSELFKEHLNKSRYSEKQLAIWRLFAHFIDNKPGVRNCLLTEKTSQAIIGSDPFFFETLVRTLQPLKTDEITTFAEILKSRVLTEETAICLSKESAQLIVNNISKQNHLSDLVEAAVENKDLSDFSVSISCGNENEEKLSSKFQRFLKTGKLTIQDTNECYTLLKMAIDDKKSGVANFLEKYLITRLEEFLSDKNLQTLLDEIKEYQMEKLKKSIDIYLKKSWKAPEQPPFYSKSFEDDLSFANNNQLSNLSKSMGAHYAKSLKELMLPEEVHVLNNLIQTISNQGEKLFPGKHDQTILHGILEKHISVFLTSSPNKLEPLLGAAEKSKNLLLIALIKNIYKENKQFFSAYMLSPLGDV